MPASWGPSINLGDEINTEFEDAYGSVSPMGSSFSSIDPMVVTVLTSFGLMLSSSILFNRMKWQVNDVSDSVFHVIGNLYA